MLTAVRVLLKRSKLERTSQWTRARLLEHQTRSADAVRRFALRYSPFYRRFHRGLESRPLSELPILTKPTMMENFDNLVTDRTIHRNQVEDFLCQGGAALFQGRYVALATSGSTGLRGIFLFNSREWLNALAYIARPIGWTGAKSNPFRPMRTAMVASTTATHYSARVGLSLASRLIPTLRFDALEPIEMMVHRLNEWCPEVLAAYPSLLRNLAEEQIEGRLRIRLRHIATSAEVLTPETRRLVEQAWHVKIYETYGATEFAPIAAECSHGRKHLFEDGAIIEIVDERGEPAPPGVTGDRILLTVFNRTTQPLIRYEISDMVRPVAGECECGRPFALIEMVEGRTGEVLQFPGRGDGVVSIHPKEFHRLLETVPATGWQVVDDEGELTIRLKGLRDPEVCGRIERSIREHLDREGAMIPLVRAIPVADLERGATGKAPLIVSRKSKQVKAAVQ